MNFKRPAFFGVATIALALASGAAFAHEGAHKNPNGPVKKEQKPWGIAGDARAATRTVGIAMGDTMRFTPSSVEVRQGETVRFVISNKGRLLHEMVIGDKQTLAEHAALMARFPTMEHDEPMVFAVKDAAILTQVKPGDKVRFKAIDDRGKLTVLDIEAAK